MGTQMLSDTDLSSNIRAIGRRRERKRYWRPDGKGGWMQTGLLPADVEGRASYLAKGFRIEKPETESQAVKPGSGVTTKIDVSDGMVHCPLCDFKTEKPIGLRSHLRVHIENSEKEEKK